MFVEWSECYNQHMNTQYTIHNIQMFLYAILIYFFLSLSTTLCVYLFLFLGERVHTAN